MKIHWSSWAIGVSIFLLVFFGIAWATITALNQLFGLNITHSLLSYVNMMFLIIIIRGITSPRFDKLQVRNRKNEA